MDPQILPPKAPQRARRLRKEGCLAPCGCSLMTCGIVAGVYVLGFVALLAAMWDDLTGPPYGTDAPSSGWFAVWLDDLDGDVVTDFALRTWFEPRRAAEGESGAWGVTRILSGATGKEMRSFKGLATGRLHKGIGAAGDADGDGHPEIWRRGEQNTLLLEPATEGPARIELSVDPDTVVIRLGDVDSDGCEDLLIRGFPDCVERLEAVTAISGRTGEALWTLREPAADPPRSVHFGSRICRLGDLGGDGGVAIAMVNEDKQVVLVDGQSGATLGTLPLVVDPVHGRLDSLGDLDGDGRPELLHYEGWRSWEEIQKGASPKPIQVVSTAAGQVLVSFEVDDYVQNVFSPGDVNGDGFADAAWQSKALEVVSAKDGRSLHHIADVDVEPGRGDWNGDGCADLLVTRNVYLDPNEKAPADLWRKGRVEIVSGEDGSILKVFDESVLPPLSR